MKKVCIIGHFGFGYNLSNGQTIKTKIVYSELTKIYGKEQIMTVDTCGGLKKMPYICIRLLQHFKDCENIIIMPAQNGVKFFVPLCNFFNLFFRRYLIYVVIGGWLPDVVSVKKSLRKGLKKFNIIFVETTEMANRLEKLWLFNTRVVPNCKKLPILKNEDFTYITSPPFRICTFSRVMKEKGIEEAVRAVEKVNIALNHNVFHLDIYGQIELGQKSWFENLCRSFPSYISYRGVVPFGKSTEVLKEYYALLFPTYYEGEGFAGTLIDAMAAGVPVIASDWKYNREIVQNGINGKLISSPMSEELSEALIEIYENPGKWNEMKVSAVDQAKKYTPELALQPLFFFLENHELNKEKL